MKIRFSSILYLALLTLFFTSTTRAYKTPEFKFIKSMEGLLLKSIGYKPQGIYYYTKTNHDQTIHISSAVTGTEFLKFDLPLYAGITSLSLMSPFNKGALFGCSGVVNSYIFDGLNKKTTETFDNSIIELGYTALSFDGKYFITMPLWYFVKQRDISIYDSATRSKLRFLPFDGRLTSLDVASQSNYLAAGTEETFVILWQFPSPQVYSLNRHTASVNSVSFSYDGQYLLSASDDKTVILWSVKTQKMLHTFAVGEEVKAVQWMPDDKYFATVTNNNIMIWHMPTKTRVATTMLEKPKSNRLLGPNFRGTLIEFHPMGNYVAIQQQYASNFQVYGNTQQKK